MKNVFPLWIVIFSLFASFGFAQIADPFEEELEELERPEAPERISTTAELEGLWEVSYIYDKFQPFDELFPNRKPTLYFDIVNQQAFGYTGCNTFSIFTYLEGNGIDVLGFLGMTKKWCDGHGEDIFLTVLKSAHTFAIDDEGILSFSCGNMEIMKLKKLERNDDYHPFGIPKMMATQKLLF
ncbi:META domain-containing protein [Negadavirga shengliensis]|uniref:META domain-containing protein n=1 Tax=Negadavirga shengliensis TaxID=1389218 RepID=A0ABV9SYU1_9BACT